MRVAGPRAERSGRRYRYLQNGLVATNVSMERTSRIPWSRRHDVSTRVDKVDDMSCGSTLSSGTRSFLW